MANAQFENPDDLPGLKRPFAVPAPLGLLERHLKQKGGRTIAVGGCVRDHVLGLEPLDFDLEVYGLSLEELRASLAEIGKVHEVGRSFGVMKTHIFAKSEDMVVDVALPRRENKIGRGHRGFIVDSDPDMSFEEASARRDFTMNAMGIELESGQLLDPHNGRSDLQTRELRHVSGAFSEDPLRVLRACQFASRFGLSIHPTTETLCKQLNSELASVSQERLWNEIKKLLLLSPWPSIGLWAMEKTGALSLFPELKALQECPQEPEWHPEGDVWVHTLMVVDEAAQIARDERLSEEEALILLLAAVCHDFGKPVTTTRAKGQIRSPMHEQAGEQPSNRFLKKIGAPETIRTSVLPLVLEHLKPYQLYRDRKKVTDAAIRRLSCRVSIPRLLRIAKADFLGRTTDQALSRVDEAGEWLTRETERLYVKESAPKPILQGRHLLEYGFSPGPELGELLKCAFEAQLNGAFSNLEDALSWLNSKSTNTSHKGST
jgi:tRNA nucleotidyltransferase (CCA-adding enzyme)